MQRNPGGRALALAISVALFGPTVVLSEANAAPSASPDATVPGTASASEALVSTLLTANDLPEGMSSAGVTDGSAFTIDPAAFNANDGLEIAQRTWSAGEPGSVLRVFDFRFLFPSPEAAQAYLDAAGRTLSEAATGLSEVSGDPQIGDGYRHYAGEVVANEQAAGLHNVFFRIGPVVAKVVVGGVGTTWADAVPIIRAAAGRVVNPTADGGPRFATPDPSGQPSAEPTPGATGVATPGTSPPGVQSTDPIRQWAAAAAASTEFGSSGWSAQNAVGEPDVEAHADDQRAWTPKAEDGTIDWLDLRYDHAVVPTEVAIHESFDPGFVTKVEAYHTAEAEWVTLWEGIDPTPAGDMGVFRPPLEQSDVAVDRIRVTIDTNIPDWNEIDAVELVGVPPP